MLDFADPATAPDTRSFSTEEVTAVIDALARAAFVKSAEARRWRRDGTGLVVYYLLSMSTLMFTNPRDPAVSWGGAIITVATVGYLAFLWWSAWVCKRELARLSENVVRVVPKFTSRVTDRGIVTSLDLNVTHEPRR